MKGKQLALLLLAAGLLGGLWYLTGGRHQRAWSDTGNAGTRVVEFPLNDVAQIVITGPGGVLHLVRKADLWTVQERGDYPANFEDVSSLLRRLWELKRVQVVRVGPSQLPRLELGDPRQGTKGGTLVELRDGAGKAINAVILGKKYLRKDAGTGAGFEGASGGLPAGRYVKRLDGETAAVVTQTFEDADPNPTRWLARDFVQIERAKTVAVAGPGNAWSISRDAATAPWKMDDRKPDETFDAAKVAGVDGMLSSLTFADVLAPGAPIGEPVTTLSVVTFDGFRYELRLGPEQGANAPALITVSADLPALRPLAPDEKPADKTRLDADFAATRQKLADKLAKEKAVERRPYLIAQSSIDALVKARADLLAPKPTPSPTPPAAPVAPPAAATPAPTTPANAP